MTDNIIPYSVLFFILSLTISLFSLSRIIPKLRGVANQPIYAEGPSWHLGKSGTPTMGGIAFLLTFFLLSLLSIFMVKAPAERLSLILLSAFSLLNGAVGIFDDIMKLKREENQGLTARQKLILQAALASVFLLVRQVAFGDGTEISLFGFTLDLGIFYYPFSIILILGAINCANLTDGVDGLLSSTAFIISVIMTTISALSNSIFVLPAVTLIGITLAFLFHNIHPARVFMGDTGSLFIGALIISTLYSMERPTYFFSLGSVFIIEGVSVILQVIFFKLRKKRLFLMSPLHHHLERRGISENRICIIAVITTILLSLPALIYEVML